jgi:hypothetical protein
MDDAVRELLTELVAKHGRELAVEAKRCRALLADRCGGDRYRAEQSVL